MIADRLLMIANPALGVLRYQDNYYAFCTKEAAYEFTNAPDRLVELSARTQKAVRMHKGRTCLKNAFVLNFNLSTIIAVDRIGS